MGRIEGNENSKKEKLPKISYTDKMIVAVMGAVFNIIFAVILTLIIWGIGRETIRSTVIGNVPENIIDFKQEILPNPAFVAGIKEGDEIIEVDGNKVNNWWSYMNSMATGVGRADDGRAEAIIKVKRSSQLIEFKTYPILVSSEKMRSIGVAPQTDSNSSPIVLKLETDMPAYDAGLKIGDRLVSLDNEPIVSGEFLKKYLKKNGDRFILVGIERNSKEISISIKPRIKTESGETIPRFGFSYDYDYKVELIHENPINQIMGFTEIMQKTLFALLNKNSDIEIKNMSGPVGIVHGLNIMARQDLVNFIWFIALINVNLALFNLLPIPVLDGGHMLFATISKFVKPIPIIVMEKIQSIFVMLLLMFIFYVTFFDLKRLNLNLFPKEKIENIEQP